MPSPLTKAIELVNSGQREAARKICDTLQQTDANNPEVVHLLGVIAAQDNQPELAIDAFERVISMRADWPEALCQYQRLMGHWHNTLPQRVLDFSYEHLIAAPEEATRQLLDGCGNSWRR